MKSKFEIIPHLKPFSFKKHQILSNTKYKSKVDGLMGIAPTSREILYHTFGKFFSFQINTLKKDAEWVEIKVLSMFRFS